MRPIDQVIPYARNPRKNDDAVAVVAASLKEFGFRQPIVVDPDGVVIVGHTRLKAARQLGMTEVPVHVAQGLSKSQVKAYRIADNKVAEAAEWDEMLLSLEIDEIKEIDMSAFGFEPPSIVDETDHKSLSDRFMVPPFSVLNAREGWWQDRKRSWLALGIKSEEGRTAVAFHQDSLNTTMTPGGKKTKDYQHQHVGGVLMKSDSGNDPRYYAKSRRRREDWGAS